MTYDIMSWVWAASENINFYFMACPEQGRRGLTLYPARTTVVELKSRRRDGTWKGSSRKASGDSGRHNAAGMCALAWSSVWLGGGLPDQAGGSRA